MFILNEKRLQLLQPLDRDEENLSHIVFQVTAAAAASCRYSYLVIDRIKL